MSLPAKQSEKAESAEEALYHLQQIDELLNLDSGEDQATIASYLKSDQDLTAVLRRHDEELQKLCDEYVQVHVLDAENICRVYHNFCACDDQLVDFETEIVTFQRKLDEAAHDVGLMQQQTDVLVRSVANRRLVSNKINEVYDALQECDAFCEEIANKDVDVNYLTNLRELERKLSFLSKNKALQNSAVDNEIRPKLTAAAHRAGDKLQRFLSRKISALADDPAHMEQNQAELEQSGQFAVSFLQSYNKPVARELVKLYVRTMADIFSKSFRGLLRDFSEASEIHAGPLEPIVSPEELAEMLANRDSGSPSGNQVAVPPATGYPGRTLARRERSVSQHMRGLTDKLTTPTGAPLRTLRETTFEDTVKAINCIAVRHGKLQADPAIAAQLDQCNSWVWQFVKCIQTLVNTCVSECRFIGNFFCLVDDSSTDVFENFKESETIARAVLGKALSAVEASIQEDVPMVMERTAVLAALRVIDMAKQFLCTSQDPVPLMLLSGVLEMSKASLKNSLRTALKSDQAALAYLPGVKLCAFRQSPPQRATTAKLLENRAYAATLGPHPILLRIGELLGQLDLLNNASLAGAVYSRGAGPAAGAAREPPPPPTAARQGSSAATPRGSGSGAAAGAAVSTPAGASTAYDPFVSSFIDSALGSLQALTPLLARRHSSTLAASIFGAVNAYCVLASWTSMAARYPSHSSSGPHPRRVSFAVGGGAEGQTEAGPLAGLGVGYTLGGGALPSALSEAHLRRLEWGLAREISAWVDADADVNDTFAFLFRFVAQVEAGVGPDFFKSDEPPSVAASALAPSLSAEATLETASQFSSVWQERLRGVSADMGKLVQASLGAVPAGRGSGPLIQQRCEELHQLAARTYLQAVADANAKLNTFATVVYGGNNELQARLVSNTTVLHEMRRTVKA